MKPERPPAPPRATKQHVSLDAQVPHPGVIQPLVFSQIPTHPQGESCCPSRGTPKSTPASPPQPTTAPQAASLPPSHPPNNFSSSWWPQQPSHKATQITTCLPQTLPNSTLSGRGSNSLGPSLTHSGTSHAGLLRVPRSHLRAWPCLFTLPEHSAPELHVNHPTGHLLRKAFLPQTSRDPGHGRSSFLPTLSSVITLLLVSLAGEVSHADRDRSVWLMDGAPAPRMGLADSRCHTAVSR